MALTNRVTFKNEDGTNVYTVPINPSSVNIPTSDEGAMTIYQIIDGDPVFFDKPDTRTHSLIWENLPYDKYNSMVNTLLTYSKQFKLLNLGDIGAVLNKFTTDTRIFVIGVEITLKERSKFKYAKVELKFRVV